MWRRSTGDEIHEALGALWAVRAESTADGETGERARVFALVPGTSYQGESMSGMRAGGQSSPMRGHGLPMRGRSLSLPGPMPGPMHA